MRSAGLSGKGKGGAPITTREPKGPDLRPDLVNREFRAPWPSSSVGDGHYLRAHQERLCVHRVRDRCILPEDRRMGAVRLDAHRSFAAAGARPGDRVAKETTGLIHHLDHGLQGGFNWSSQHPEHGGVRRWLPRTGVRRPVICRWGAASVACGSGVAACDAFPG